MKITTYPLGEPMPQPDIRPYKESGQLYRAHAEFRVDIDDISIVIPKGFVTDGASSPRITWSLTGFARDGMHRAAAHVHDWLYFRRGRIPDYPATGRTVTYSRAWADAVFYALLKHYGIMSWHASLAYTATRIGGRFYWRD